MRLYVYGEQCQVMGGRIYQGDDPDSLGDDLLLWGDAPEHVLIAMARRRLMERRDSRPGGSGDAFGWRVARNVLQLFGEEEDPDAPSVCADCGCEYPYDPADDDDLCDTCRERRGIDG